MDTFAQFRTGVLSFYNAGADTTKLQYDAVADYVKGKIEREVNQDLERSKSYFNSWLLLKTRLAGMPTSVPFVTMKPGVLTRITVDSQRSAIDAVNDLWIQEAMDEINAMTLVFDSLLKACCVDLQRKVMCYQIGNYYYLNSALAYTTNTGWATKIPISNFAAAVTPEILAVEYGRYAPPLAVAAYALGDFVMSNGRIYKCVVAGSVTVIGNGLTSLDRTDEVLGTATFKYEETLAWVQVTALDWLQQSKMTERKLPGGPYYTVDPSNTFIYVTPALSVSDTTRQFRVQYNGLKIAFADVDPVTFDFPTQKAAAHYVRGYLEEAANADRGMAATELGMYAGELRRLWIDCTRRQSSTLTRNF